MSYLEKATKATAQPPVITIVGFPGAGKTLLAMTFDKPIFIQAENSKTVFEKVPENLQPTFFPELPKPDKEKDVRPSKIILDQLRELVTADHGFKTLFIDTVSSLNQMFEDEVIAFDPAGKTTMGECAGGFQNAYGLSAAMHFEVRRACEFLRRKGMTIVFLSHTGVEKMKNSPELDSDYKVFTLDMHVKSRSAYLKHSDAVIYLKIKEKITGAEENKKGQTIKYGRILNTGERVAITSSTGTVGYVEAKNRYDMPAEVVMPIGENPLLSYISIFNNKAQEK